MSVSRVDGESRSRAPTWLMRLAQMGQHHRWRHHAHRLESDRVIARTWRSMHVIGAECPGGSAPARNHDKADRPRGKRTRAAETNEHLPGELLSHTGRPSARTVRSALDRG